MMSVSSCFPSHHTTGIYIHKSTALYLVSRKGSASSSDSAELVAVECESASSASAEPSPTTPEETQQPAPVALVDPAELFSPPCFTDLETAKTRSPSAELDVAGERAPAGSKQWFEGGGYTAVNRNTPEHSDLTRGCQSGQLPPFPPRLHVHGLTCPKSTLSSYTNPYAYVLR